MPGAGAEDENDAGQLIFLIVLAIPIASIAWTVTHEEVFREPHEWCVAKSKSCRHLLSRKAFYLFTCEYCFSHWVTALFLLITRYRLLFDDWRGYLIAGFSLVWLANVYMSVFGRLRLEIREDRMEIARAESKARSSAAVGGGVAACGVLACSLQHTDLVLAWHILT